jgi:hypothetical protein
VLRTQGDIRGMSSARFVFLVVLQLAEGADTDHLAWAVPDSHDMSLLQQSLEVQQRAAEDERAADTQTKPKQSAVPPTSRQITFDGLSPVPPILHLKIHKTGSSTLATIIARMGDRRNLSFMFPVDETNHLGWPGPFPGKGHGPPDHQFDVLNSHTVLNISLMYAYLKPEPHVIMSLRDPVQQVISSKNYFCPSLTWDEYLTSMRMESPQSRAPASARCRNNFDYYVHPNQQAYDLGWYDFVGGGNTRCDNNHTKINEWLGVLDEAVDSVVISEFFDQGLVLWRQKLGVELEEITYLWKKRTEEKVEPTEDQLEIIVSLHQVDLALYAHFNATFWEEWTHSNITKLDAEVVALNGLNHDLEQACEKNDGTLCPSERQMDSTEYMQYLKESMA